jgi:O-antigen ligase
MVAKHQSRLSLAHTTGRDLSPQLQERSAIALLGLLFFSVLTVWIQVSWAASLFHGAIFGLTAFVSICLIPLDVRCRGNALLFPLGGIIALGLLQIATRRTVYPWETWNAVVIWSASFALVFISVQLFRTSAARWHFLSSAFYFGFAISSIALAQLSFSPGKAFGLFETGFRDHVMGPFVSRNLYAAFVELLLPIGLLRAVTLRRHQAFRYTAMSGVMFVSVVVCASRAGILLICAEAVALLLLACFRKLVSTRKVVIALSLFALSSAAFLVLLGQTSAWTRFLEAEPYAARRQMLRSSLDMLHERPWMGFGFGTWHTVYPAFAYYDDGTVTSHAHNDWAEWAAEGGLPLFLMMLGVAILSVRPAIRSLWGIGILAVLGHCAVDSPLQNPAFAAWFFVVSGLLAVNQTQIPDTPEPAATCSL